MLLRALHDFAQSRKLLDSLPVQTRTIHFVIALSRSGEVIGEGVSPLTTRSAKGKEEIGVDYPMPRFPGENNGGKAYFLAESCVCVFGMNKKTGLPIFADPSATKKKSEKNDAKAFLHFWSQVEEAHKSTQLPSLRAMLEFKKRYLLIVEARIKANLSWFKMEPNRKGENKLMGKTLAGTWKPLEKAVISFKMQEEPDLIFTAVPKHALTQYWTNTFLQQAFTEDESSPEAPPSGALGICLVTENQNEPIARSHKPRILGVPNLSSGGYVVSFAQDSPSFSSYGFVMGENCPVSEQAAASYSLALSHLLDNDTTHLKMGPFVACFWARESKQASTLFGRILKSPKPQSIRTFLISPLAGVLTRDKLKRDEFYSVSLSGNAGRVVVRQWIQQPLKLAGLMLKKWFRDLKLATIEPKEHDDHPGTNLERLNANPPLAIEQLAAATVRDPAFDSKRGKPGIPADVYAQLYRAAYEGYAPSVSLLKPILRRIESDLTKLGSGVLKTPLPRDVEQKCRESKHPIPPPGQTRFALLKLILNRNRKNTDMTIPSTSVADTTDPAYNCGRLLSIFDSLQRSSHDSKFDGVTIAERYFGSASSAPNAAFSILWRLHHHHLKKLRQKSEKGQGAACRIKQIIMEVCWRFQQKPLPDGSISDAAPQFPRTFTLMEQGRFALGFYHQQAVRAAAIKAWLELKKAAGKKVTDDDVPEEELFENPQP